MKKGTEVVDVNAGQGRNQQADQAENAIYLDKIKTEFSSNPPRRESYRDYYLQLVACAERLDLTKNNRFPTTTISADNHLSVIHPEQMIELIRNNCDKYLRNFFSRFKLGKTFKSDIMANLLVLALNEGQYECAKLLFEYHQSSQKSHSFSGELRRGTTFEPAKPFFHFALSGKNISCLQMVTPVQSNIIRYLHPGPYCGQLMDLLTDLLLDSANTELLKKFFNILIEQNALSTFITSIQSDQEDNRYPVQVLLFICCHFPQFQPQILSIELTRNHERTLSAFSICEVLPGRESFLILAVQKKNLLAVTKLIEAGVPVTPAVMAACQDPSYRTVLAWASSHQKSVNSAPKEPLELKAARASGSPLHNAASGDNYSGDLAPSSKASSKP